jgi:hypothetical protein
VSTVNTKPAQDETSATALRFLAILFGRVRELGGDEPGDMFIEDGSGTEPMARIASWNGADRASGRASPRLRGDAGFSVKGTMVAASYGRAGRREFATAGHRGLLRAATKLAPSVLG